MNAGSARYAREGGIWFLRLAGDLRHPLGPALEAFLDRALSDPATTGFVIDLCQAEGIDSTCLGILARIGNAARRNGDPPPTLLSTSDDINLTLRAVCFDRLFALVEESAQAGAETRVIEAVESDTDSMRNLLIAAHRRLCGIDAQNQVIFRDLIQALEDESGPDRD